MNEDTSSEYEELERDQFVQDALSLAISIVLLAIIAVICWPYLK